MAERETANQSAALRQMEMEAQRMERRLQEWTLASERNRDARTQKQEIAKAAGAAASRTERVGLSRSLAELQAQLDGLRAAARAA